MVSDMAGAAQPFHMAHYQDGFVPFAAFWGRRISLLAMTEKIG
jgi:hypothetical protein